MVSSPLITLLAFAASSTCWPQISAESSKINLVPRSLPTVEEAESLGTLHIAQRRSLPVSDDLDDTVFTLPILHAPKPALVGRSLDVQLENRSDVAYYAELYIGTPPQQVYAQIDTGSFELWLNPSCSSLKSQSDKTFCEATGQYSGDDSSSGKDTGDSTDLNYGIGQAKIDYYEDDVGFSKDKRLKGIRFGVASESEDQFAGVLGLGYGEGVNTKYPNVLDEMLEQGFIKTHTFSVALGSKSEGGGAVSFGGVDTGKFRGELAALPIIPADDSPDGVARYWVQLDGISHNGNKYSSSSMQVFLDTGATLTLLPESLVKTIADDLDSPGKDEAGFYEIDCSLVNEPGTLDFAFDGVTIKVPYKEVVREFSKGCYLGISESDEFTLLGDTFLRSAYVVFDLESDTIFMAPYENCGGDVSSIKSSKDLKGLKGSCGSSVSEVEEDDSKESDNKATGDDSPKPTTSIAPPATTSEDLPVVTEKVVTSSSGSSATTLTMTTTASKPTETGDDEGEDGESDGESLDGSTGRGGAEGSGEEANSEEPDNDNSAGQLGGWPAVVVGAVMVMIAL